MAVVGGLGHQREIKAMSGLRLVPVHNADGVNELREETHKTFRDKTYMTSRASLLILLLVGVTFSETGPSYARSASCATTDGREGCEVLRNQRTSGRHVRGTR